MRAAGVDVLLVGIDMKMELEDAACASIVSSNTNRSSYVTSWNTSHHHKRYIDIYRKRVREGGNASKRCYRCNHLHILQRSANNRRRNRYSN